MLKSDYIISEHENTLLIQGYICIKTDEKGTQTWTDMLEAGVDVYHHISAYSYIAPHATPHPTPRVVVVTATV